MRTEKKNLVRLFEIVVCAALDMQERMFQQANTSPSRRRVYGKLPGHE